VVGQARLGELERATRQLGVTSTTLRQHRWKTASAARVKAAAVDARWVPEVRRAKREARRLAGELSPDQMQARIGREGRLRRGDCYRAGRLLRQALEG
jgi:hypothetical protein